MNKHVYHIPGPNEIEVCSIIMSEKEYNNFLDFLKKESGPIKNARTGVPITEAEIEQLRKSKCIPAIKRGTMTEFIFKKLDVSQDALTIAVKGFAERFFQQMQAKGLEALMPDKIEELDNQVEKEWINLPEEVQKDITETISKIQISLESQNKDLEIVILTFLRKHSGALERSIIFKLYDQTIHSINYTITLNPQAKIQDLGGYLKRLFLALYLTLKTSRDN